jgi:hypothetical protein
MGGAESSDPTFDIRHSKLWKSLAALARFADSTLSLHQIGFDRSLGKRYQNVVPKPLQKLLAKSVRLRLAVLWSAWTFGPHKQSDSMKIKMRAAILLVPVSVLTAVTAHAYPVPIPPGNIVINGNFQSPFANWSGSAAGYLGAWPSVPNDAAALATDIYQNLQTTPGQAYSLSFYAAADLFFGPSTTVSVSVDHATLLSFTTPPYAYLQENRYDQMHWQKVTGTFVASLILIGGAAVATARRYFRIG